MKTTILTVLVLGLAVMEARAGGVSFDWESRYEPGRVTHEVRDIQPHPDDIPGAEVEGVIPVPRKSLLQGIFGPVIGFFASVEPSDPDVFGSEEHVFRSEGIGRFEGRAVLRGGGVKFPEWMGGSGDGRRFERRRQSFDRGTDGLSPPRPRQPRGGGGGAEQPHPRPKIVGEKGGKGKRK